jgi:dipeptidyl aminopeptidase/acylaminoacyl peptidase
MLRDDIRESGGNDTLRRALKQDVGNGSDMQQVSPVTFADRADAPILLIHGKDDIVVPFSQSTDMLNALKRAGKPAELVTLAGEDHWLSKSATRLTMLKAAVAFVEQHNPADK